MDLQPRLESEIIFIRPLTPNDFDTLYEVAKDPLIWEQHPCNDRYKPKVFEDFFEESINSKGALIIIEKSNNSVIGSSRYKPISKVDTAVEIGWSFLSRYCWGGKFNKAVKQLMIDHAFKFVEDIIFYIGRENIRSQKAVIKIGGKRIVNRSLKHLIKDSDEDWTYRINKNEWLINE